MESESKTEPIICFGQQPAGFFPKRFLVAKINTARKLQEQIGGKIVFFYHDSDADYRETTTLMKDKVTGEDARINFEMQNKIQKKYSPLYAKKIKAGWQDEVSRKLPRLVDQELLEIFKSIKAETVADFCLEMYKKLGLLEGIEVMRSGDKRFREAASPAGGGVNLQEYYSDVEYENEVVRALMRDGKLVLHEGGGKYFEIPTPAKIEKWQKNPGRAERFAWMQSVINCTHYISGESEDEYLKKEDFPEVIFIKRDSITESNYANI